MSFSGENYVNFGKLFVIVRSGVGFDLQKVHRCRAVGHIGKAAPRPTAGAADGVEHVELGDDVVFGHDGSGAHFAEFCNAATEASPLDCAIRDYTRTPPADLPKRQGTAALQNASGRG